MTRRDLSLRAVAAVLLGGCYASHGPTDGGAVPRDAGPRVCQAESFDACCAIDGCNWYSRHAGCFHPGEESCLSDAECPSDRRCDVRRYPSTDDECAGSGLPLHTERGFCVAR